MLKFPNQDRGPTIWKKWSSIEQTKAPERGKLCLISWKKDTEIQGRHVSSRTYEEVNPRGKALNSKSRAFNCASIALNSMNRAFNYRGSASNSRGNKLNFKSRAIDYADSALNSMNIALNYSSNASNYRGNKLNFASNAIDYADSALNSSDIGLNMPIENMTIRMKNTVNRKTNVH